MTAVITSMFDHAQKRRLDTDAPSHVTVPSGSSIRLDYRPGESPVLAVKLQEMFGLADTPRVARGRVPVTLHLLSPARRPIQVTQDLKGFWERTYAEVKKELKGRYPKHPWPDDPWNAVPTARAKRRL
jgi:ATP-dependent helicase HrpB